MIFYNGFNLLVDVVVALVSLAAGYKFGWWAGLHRGLEIADEQATECCAWTSWHPEPDSATLAEADGTYLAEHQD